MRKITIIEEREYARRLTDYLSNHMEEQIRIDSYTSSVNFLDNKIESDLYIIGEDIYEELVVRGVAPPKEKILLICEEKRSGTYYKWDSPKSLRILAEEYFYSLRKSAPCFSNAPVCSAVGIYTPCPVENLREIIWSRIPEGGIYFGFEDIGEQREENSAMEKLCYYIRLHENLVFDDLRGMVCCKDGRYYLDSPPWYFDFLGLEEEDFHWFFDELKERNQYSEIYIGFGSAVVTSMEFFCMFDRLIFHDESGRKNIRSFCEKLGQTIVEENYIKESNICWL